MPCKLTARIVKRNPRHARIKVFQNHGPAGDLVVEAECADAIVDHLNAFPGVPVEEAEPDAAL